MKLVSLLLLAFSVPLWSQSTVVINAPKDGTIVTTPVAIQTTVFIDPQVCPGGLLKQQVLPTPGNVLIQTTQLAVNSTQVLNPGSYPVFAVQAWDKCGNTIAVSESVTVTGSVPLHSCLTWGCTPRRDNTNTGEYILTPNNVASATFGKKFSYQVDGYIYGQPLYVPNLTIAGATHNVVYVATENNSVYAFDASGGGVLWHTNFGNAVPCHVVEGGCGLSPVMGITATPVIDLARTSIYLESRQFDPVALVHRHTLHSLNLLTGLENTNSPVAITAKVQGVIGYDADSSNAITFNPQNENDRSALLELSGIVYLAYSSLGDADPYHGWILGYSATSLAQVSVFNTSSDGGEAGIWNGMLATDGSFIFAATGNGDWDGFDNWGETYLKLSPKTLAIADYFTPYNFATLNSNDTDLGSAMANILPSNISTKYPHEMIACGKQGKIYVINRDAMGGYNAASDSIIQNIGYAVGVSGVPRNFSTPPYWHKNLYFSGNGDQVKQFQFIASTGTLGRTPIARSPETFAFPGGQLMVSANGGGSGILWVVQPGTATTAPVLRAYDANQISTELYNSAQSAADALPSFVKFAPPLVINGQVFVGTHNALYVYGLL